MCVCACVRACVRACGCMVQWFVQSISSRNIVGSIPAEYGFTRLSSPSLSLSMHGGQKGIVTGQKQPLGAVW